MTQGDSLRTQHVALTLVLTMLAAGLAACDSDDRPARPKDPGPVIDDIPVVILPDNGPTDPGTSHDEGAPADAEDATDPGDAPDSATDTADDAATDPGTTKPDVCIPQCAGRNCGSDGCGGYCGSCEGSDICIDGNCVCIPDCNDKQCGDDECGGSCGTCPDGLDCDETSFQCATTGPCPTSSSLTFTCPSEDSNRWASRTGQLPNGNKVVFYGGACQRYAVGPEKALRYVAPETGQVTLTMSGSGGAALPATLDAYVVQGSTCDGANCIAWGHDSVQFEAAAGETYWLMVDATISTDELFQMDFDASWCLDASK